MANFVYPKAKEAILNADIDFLVDNISIALAGYQYIPNLNIDQFLSDIPVYAVKEKSVQLQNVTTVSGILDADDINILNYSGSDFNSIIIYKNTGLDATSRLIAYIDSSPGLPFLGTVSSSPITIIWNNDSTKIISL